MKFNVTVWNHGLAGDLSVPGDEVDIVDIRSGESIRFEIIEELMNACNHNLSTIHKDVFIRLPTERWLDVEIYVSFEDDGFEFNVIHYQEKDNNQL